ncbi:purine-cytosine permease family protein [Corynebacterium glyciniphilum]|uniref:purine-cytosine permease family protein n=1 Tax=Corynebacterium glyciniphilum TaxID=1404244 RepID=UPI003FD0D90D
MTASTTTRPPIENDLLFDEYEHEPVPTHSRRSLRSVSAVWLGFPMIMTSAVFGGVITYNLGFLQGLLAIVVGNALLMAYVGSLSYIAGATGESFALTARKVFGSRGSIVVSGILATLVIGWFALQTGMVGDILGANYGWPTVLCTVVAGLGFIAVTFLGIRALAIIGVIGSGMFVVVGIAAVFLAFNGHDFSDLTGFSSGAGAGALSFGACVTIVVACFIDSGTMTADFTRWARTGREAVAASFAAFPFGNMFAQVVGAVIVALGASQNPADDGGDFMHLLVSHGGWLVPVALIFVVVNLGSVCSHCLYNGAVGWSQITGMRMRMLTLLLGALGVVVAAMGVTDHFLVWLDFLGTFVPPLGAVIIVHQLITRFGNGIETTTFHTRSFSAWACGAAVAFLSWQFFPAASSAFVGITVSAVATYIFLHRRTPEPGVSEPSEPSAA